LLASSQIIVAAAFAGAGQSTSTSLSSPLALTSIDRSLLVEWKPAYKRGFAMQVSLAIAGFLLGLLAWRQTENWRWLVGGVLLIANWP
jgi:hypothetical protein